MLAYLRRNIVCAVALVVSSSVVVGAQTYEMNLAESGDTSMKAGVDAGSHTVTFRNLLPVRSYLLSIQHHALPIEPFPATAIPMFKPPTPAEAARPVNCPALQAASKALADAVVETVVPALVASIRHELDAGCTDTAIADAARALVASTSRSSVVSVASGEEAVVALQRGATDATHPAKQWTLTLTGPPRGQALITYGFAIARNRDQHFFTKAADNNKFVVTRERDETGASVVPSIYFSWLPTDADWHGWTASPTIGFGAKNDAPAVLIGGNFNYHWNLGFVAGVGMLQEKRLLGQYTENQVVTENLTEDQLHQKVWRPSLFVAATVRFGSNPFGGDDKKPASSGGGGTPAAGNGGGSAAAGAGGGAPAGAPVPATPAPAPAGESGATATMSFSTAGHRLFFTEGGDLDASSVSARARLLDAVAGATDVFVLSHGWWNSPGTADCRYQQIVDGLRSRAPAALPAPFKPVFVGIYWPSVIFPTETGDCASPIRTPQGAEAMVQGSFEADLAAWAAAAFPTAAGRAGFAAERTRVIELLGRERQGETLTRVEAIELATILDRWRRAAPNTSAPAADGPAELFSDTPAAIVDQWMTTSRSGPVETSVLRKVLDFGNAFTFWTMKERAGVVGSRGVFDLVRAIRERGGSNLRIHLVGHSFGGRLLSASVAGMRAPTLNEVDSLILLEGAFSHFAFSTKDQIAAFGFTGDTGGLFQAAVAPGAAKPAVRGRLVAVFSKQDTPNQSLYPVASRLKGSDREASRVLRYGSIGADGFQGLAARPIRLQSVTRDQLMTELRDGSAKLFNVDGSDLVLGHSDLIHDAVFDLIWGAVLASISVPR
jgi:hypothetical protein